jgi:3-hydroxyacyl-CoA dehydrogenase/enoyl-CoA hydratase/3-hydroxybutyryl-CoA epimerase
MHGVYEPFRLQIDQSTRVATLTLADDERLSPQHLAPLAATMDQVLGQQGLRGIILCSEGSDFCGGTDIELFTRASDASALLERVLQWSEAVRRLETAGLPVVALLQGKVAGVGLELALAAHYRIALDQATLSLGLPDIRLGLLPCVGAAQRLSRSIGVEAALDLLLSGRFIGRKQACDTGLVDLSCSSMSEMRDAAREWIDAHPRARQRWDRGPYRFGDGAPPASAPLADVLLGAAAALYNKTAGALEAPKLLLSALQEGSRLAMDQALEVDARYFVKSACSAQAADLMRTLWHHKRAAARGVGLPSFSEGARVRKLAIVGAGMMGAELAAVAARAGCEVVLRDVAQAALDRARSRLERLGGHEVWDRVQLTLEPTDCAGADLLLEAVFEDLELKRRVLSETEPLLAEDAIWASNTSALPIGEIGRNAGRPSQLIGLHFFSPASRMELVEVVRSAATDPAVVGAALSFCRQLRKVPILVNDSYGFYTTRVFAAYVLEGISLLAEGTSPAEIEWEARAAGMIVGPLQVADEVSIELVQHIVEQRRAFGQRWEVPRAEVVLRQMIERGRCGRAAGAGFYSYENGRRSGLWSGLGALADDSPAGTRVAPVGVGQRLLLAQAVEAANAIDEGVVERERDADLGAVLGVGFAPSRGGPIAYLRRLGADSVRESLERLSVTESRFRPPALLELLQEKPPAPPGGAGKPAGGSDAQL